MLRRSLLLALLTLSCSGGDERPDAAYRAFVRAVADRDAERAWALLSSDTRAWLEARAKAAAAAAAPGVVAPTGRQLLLGDGSVAPRALAELVVLREARDLAVVQASEEGGAAREVELVRERGWRVRIPDPVR
jgi:hypothetical protein